MSSSFLTSTLTSPGKRSLGYLALALTLSCFAFCQEAPAQQPNASSTSAAATNEYCNALGQPVTHGDSLAGFCSWVLSFDKRLPDIIGDQETRRYRTENGKDRNLIDTTSARIAYISGRSHFSDVAVNHVKIAQGDESAEFIKLYGAWSYGDYGQDLRLLFRNHANTHFTYAGESSWKNEPVYVFNYEVLENHWYQMKARKAVGEPLQTVLPPYRGKIFLDRKTGSLARFERETIDIEKQFPIRYGSNQADYKMLPLGDGTSFVLPVASSVMFCHDDKHHKCEINETTFTNWQKFAAKTRILTGTEPE